MALTLLQIVQRSASALGLRQPSAVVGSSDLTAQILLQFAIEAGEHLRDYHDWQNLIVQNSVTATSTVVQPSALPSSYQRMVYNADIWNTTRDMRYIGPTPQRVWRRVLVGSGVSTVGRWRIINNKLNIYPAPTSGSILTFETVSKNYCESSSGTDQETWMADTDVPLIPDHLFIHEIKWRFRASRGFPMYAEDMATAEREKEKAAGTDRGTGRIRPDSRNEMGPNDPIFNGTIDG